MAILEIITYPDPLLAKPCREVTELDEDLARLVRDMGETLYAKSGLGLAAVQVGDDRRVLVYDVSEERDGSEMGVLVNPRIVATEGQVVSENEGCLSVPEYRADVNRYEQVRVEGLDPEGRPVCLDADDLLAIVLQHEIDHLEGVLFIDRISSLKRELYKRRVKKRLKREEEEA
ncbi:MAG: peptide deformylase [Proteobacteria bacterium]|nr:peptide deformylase [Pseudomonadota bacterium]